MYYTVYETVCLIDNKKYVGYHATKDPNDDYLGSGKLLRKAIEKHGKDNFKKTLIFVTDSKDEALAKEKEIVNEAFVKDSNTYNLKVGGEGGWDYINNELVEDVEHMKEKYNKVRKTVKELYKNKKLVGWKINLDDSRENGFKGKTHTPNTKKLISENNANKLKKEEIDRRLIDLREVGKGYGYITKLARKWNISHTQVKRFLAKYE